MPLFVRRRTEPQPEAGEVEGERGVPIIAREASLQSRVTNALTLSLLIALGVAALIGYYWHAATHGGRAAVNGAANSAARAPNEIALPPLGPIAEPTLAAPVEPTQAVAAPEAPITLGVQSSAMAPEVLAPAAAPAAMPAPPMTETRDSPLQRRLAGSVFASLSGGSSPSSITTTASDSPAHASADPLSALLQTSVTGTVHARYGGEQRLLLPKGAFIDCTLETAIDSTLPGMTTCVTATDTFSADGSVVLIDRGTKLVGETRGQVQQGQARLFVLWTEARTPSGIVVPLDSPGADELGRAGLPGEVERHFWQRFGAAILISSVDAAVQSAVQSSQRSAGAVVYNPSSAQDVSTEVLKSTLDIAPTVVKRNGDRLQVLVARDLDFSQVYALREQHVP